MMKKISRHNSVFCFLKQKYPVIAQELHYGGEKGRSVFGPKVITLKVFFLPDGVKKVNFSFSLL